MINDMDKNSSIQYRTNLLARLWRLNKKTKIIGLTGSIGMGKSTTTNIIKNMRYDVFDSDAVVHRLTKKGEPGFFAIKSLFPDVIIKNKINRDKLGKKVFKDKKLLGILEDIIHPLVNIERKKFFSKHFIMRSKKVFLDVPLLFETGANEYCDSVLVIIAPKFLQKQRVLSRPNMTEKKLNDIVFNQESDSLKKKKASYIISSGLDKRFVRNKLKRIFYKNGR